MARVLDLMGLGLPALLAARMGEDVILATAAGTSVGTATQLGASQSAILVISSNAGSGIKLPPIGGDPGCLLGDDFTITNVQGATIAIYAANNAAGSAVSLIGNGATIAGTTGVSLLTAWQISLQAITVSTWAFNKGSA